MLSLFAVPIPAQFKQGAKDSNFKVKLDRSNFIYGSSIRNLRCALHNKKTP